MGPTSSGKSALAEQIASEHNAQLINADAFMVYRGFDIGTGKPEDRSPYLLLDVVEPADQFGLGEWIRLAASALSALFTESRSAILVGGTGLYIRALMEEYKSLSGMPNTAFRQKLMDLEREEGPEVLFERLEALRPDLAERVDRANPLRVRRALEIALTPEEPIEFNVPAFRKMKLGIGISPEENAERIRLRVASMIDRGWVEEVRGLREAGVGYDVPAMKAIGYREIWDHLEGRFSLSETEERINHATRQYAKRQRTWLRSEPGIKMVEGGANGSIFDF
jgi:tRNA dimethylallyltransferase